LTYGNTRDRLIDLGYRPIPIIPNDKRPAAKRWADPAFEAPAGFARHGVGVACGMNPAPLAAVDIDIIDDALAGEMLEYVLKTCGETIYRVGRAPKTLLVYRATEAARRKRLSKRYDCGRVEVLGYGQQFVAYGIHPDTQAPYTWPGMLGGLVDIPAAELPTISPEQIEDVIAEFEACAARRGSEPVKPESDPPAFADDYDPDDPLDVVQPLGKSIDELRTMIETMDPDSDRDHWRNVGMALHHETQGSDEGLALWDEWSAGGAKYVEGEPAAQWASFGRYAGRPLTCAYLLKHSAPSSAAEEPQDEAVPGDLFGALNWSVGRFVDDPPSLPMIVDNMLPKGIVSLMFSEGGAGKSTLSLYLNAKIALAARYPLDFFGDAVVGGQAVIVTAEDPDLVLNRRFIGVARALAEEINEPLEAVRDALRENLFIASTFGHEAQLFALKRDGALQTTANYRSLANRLSTMSNLQLVTVDTKTRYSPGEGLGNVVATQEITHYEALTGATGASVMLMHHNNKKSRDGSQGGSQAYRDATAIFDSVRAVWYLRALTKDERQAQGVSEEDEYKYSLFENSKNNYLPKKRPLVLRREGYAYEHQAMSTALTKEQQRAQERRERMDLLILALQNAGGDGWTKKGIKDIAGEINRAPGKANTFGVRRAEAAIEDALKEGLLVLDEAEARGVAHKYRLTEEGRSYGLGID
jgi:hypothetical protein